MSNVNKSILVKTFFLLIGIYAIILIITYTTFRSYAIEENEAKLQDLLMHNKALHTYVEGRLKPVFYKLKDLGKIEKGYFDPVVLSFTYMSRNIMNEYNKQRLKSNIETIEYKLAAKNSRNPINQATEEEIALLEKFNKGELEQYSRNFDKNGKNYIHYAMPVTKNAVSCMRCHGNPEDAPKSLINTYGDKAGFYEKLGDIRALISVTMPLNVELNKMYALFSVFAISLFIVFIIVYILIYYFVKKLDNKDKILIDKANKDGLTKILNRHVFNKDMEDLIKSKNNMNRFLMIIDVDHFKEINDTYGHSVGDIVLVELCERISQNIRKGDKFYRIGGEEFAILSTQTTQEDEVKFAHRIKNIISEIAFPNIGKLTISIGISKQEVEDTYKRLFERADKALYSAKDSGRNTIILL